MTNDAKLGLVVGVGLVIVVAVMFFRKDLAPHAVTENAEVTVTTSGPGARVLKAQPMSHHKVRRGVQHQTQPGETLPGLASMYYGDPARAIDIFEANRAVLDRQDLVPAGVVLFIPEPTRTTPVHQP